MYIYFWNGRRQSNSSLPTILLLILGSATIRSLVLYWLIHFDKCDMYCSILKYIIALYYKIPCLLQNRLMIPSKMHFILRIFSNENKELNSKLVTTKTHKSYIYGINWLGAWMLFLLNRKNVTMEFAICLMITTKISCYLLNECLCLLFSSTTNAKRKRCKYRSGLYLYYFRYPVYKGFEKQFFQFQRDTVNNY